RAIGDWDDGWVFVLSGTKMNAWFAATRSRSADRTKRASSPRSAAASRRTADRCPRISPNDQRIAGKNGARQLLRRQLSAVFVVAERRGSRGDRRARPACLAGDAARTVSAYSVLPEAMQVLLFPRLHRQERQGRRRLSRRPDARSRALSR